MMAFLDPIVHACPNTLMTIITAPASAHPHALVVAVYSALLADPRLPYHVHSHHSFDVIGPGYQITWSAVSPRIPAAPPDKADMDVRQ